MDEATLAETAAAVVATMERATRRTEKPIAPMLQARVKRWVNDKGQPPSHWLLSRRVARQVLGELVPVLVDEETGVMLPQDEEIPPDHLTQLFGVRVEVVEDLPQGAVLRG